MLELKNISKSYGSQLILNDISFQVKANELVSILGPSGSGKSTLLQIIGLLNQADSGIVRLDDIDYSGLHEKDKGIFRNEKLGFVFQFHNLLPEFTCQENILFPLYIREKTISEEEKERYEHISSKLGISHLGTKYPSQLSGGEQQRIAVARALINKPSLLLADEPTGNLDNTNAQNLYDLFLELKEDWSQCIIMVTYNEQLTKQSDQIIYLNSGKIM